MADNPFVGPRPYRENEPLFGRDEEAALLVELVVGARVVVIQSASGAGKSSLLEALLKPRLEQRGFRLTPTCRVAWREDDGTAPGRIDNPLIGDACRQLLGRSLPEDLSARKPLNQVLELVEARPDGDRAPEECQGLLLVFDQLEKLFQTARTAGNEARLHEFFSQVGEVLRHPRRIAILALRQEYRTALDRYAGLVPTGFGNAYTLDFLRCPQGQEVLERTFGTRGVELTPGAVGLLMSELRRLVLSRSPTSGTYSSSGVVIPSDDLSVFVEPLHLQAHGFRLWSWLEQRNDHHVPGRLHVRDLVGMPSVADALGDYYDETVKSVAAEAHVRERDLRDWIGNELIDPSGIRRLTTKPPPGGAVSAQALERLYLVRSEARNDVVWLELSHDRLAEPARERNVRRMQEFQRRAEAYGQSHIEELLLDGKDLERAVAWAAAHPDEVNAEDSRLLADSEEAERRAAIGRRRRTWAGIALLAALVGLSVWLNRLKDQAEEQRRRADQALLASRSHAISQKARELSSVGEASDTAMLLAVQAERYARQHMRTLTGGPGGSEAGAMLPAQPPALFQLALAVVDATAHRPPSGYWSRLLGEVPDVSAAVADATGELVATGNATGGVALWRRTAQGWAPEATWTVPGSGGAVASLALDPQGLWLAALTKADERLRTGGDLWLLRHAPGSLSAEAAPLAARVTAAALYSDEGRPIVVTGDLEGLVVLRARPAESGAWGAVPLAPALSAGRSVNAIVIGSSHRTVAAAGWGRIRLWRDVDGQTGRFGRSDELVGGHSERFRVRAVALTEDERELWSIGGVPSSPGSEDVVGGIVRWDVSTSPGIPSEAHPVGEFLRTLTLFRNGGAVAAGTLNSGRVRFWDRAPSARADVLGAPPLQAHDGATLALFASPATAGFASVGADDTARLWLPPLAPPRCAAGVDLGGRVGGVAVLGSDGLTGLVVAPTTANAEARVHAVPIEGIELAGDPADSGGCTSTRWAPIERSGQKTSSRPVSFAVDVRSRTVAVGTFDARIVVFRASDGSRGAAETTLVAQAPIAGSAMSFVAGGERLLAASKTVIQVLRLSGDAISSERSLAVPPPQPQSVRPAPGSWRVTALAADAGWIAAGASSPGAVWLWSASAAIAGPGAPGPRGLPLPKGEGPDVNAIAISPDGHHVAAGLDDGTVVLWELDKGGYSSLPRQGDVAVSAVAFAPHGDLLAAAYRDGVVRQWELGFEDQGHPADIQRLQAWVLDRRVHEGGIGAIAFTPDGRAIVTGGADGTLRVTPTMASLFRDLCSLAGRNLTRREWLEFVSDDAGSYECTCPQFGPGRGIASCPGEGAR